MSNYLSLKDGIWLIWPPTERIFIPVNHNQQSAIAALHLKNDDRIFIVNQNFKMVGFLTSSKQGAAKVRYYRIPLRSIPLRK